LPVRAFAERFAAEPGSPAVDAGDDIALLRQHVRPFHRPAVGDLLRSGTAVLGHQHRVFFRRVEIAGPQQIAVQFDAFRIPEREKFFDRYVPLHQRIP